MVSLEAPNPNLVPTECHIEPFVGHLLQNLEHFEDNWLLVMHSITHGKHWQVVKIFQSLVDKVHGYEEK